MRNKCLLGYHGHVNEDFVSELVLSVLCIQAVNSVGGLSEFCKISGYVSSCF